MSKSERQRGWLRVFQQFSRLHRSMSTKRSSAAGTPAMMWGAERCIYLQTVAWCFDCDSRLFSADVGMTHRQKSECLLLHPTGCQSLTTFTGSLLPWEGFSAAVTMATHHRPEVFFHLIVEVDAKHPSRMPGQMSAFKCSRWLQVGL